jgi:hypothetical protein
MENLIDIEKVISAYSGRQGCMCGCRGKYYYAKKSQEEAGNNRGYDVFDKEVNDGMVKRIANFINENRSKFAELDFHSDYIYAELSENRCYCVYLKELGE